jgi:hypothetical protein
MRFKPATLERAMDLDREIDRLMKRIEQRVAEPEVIFAAIKQLVGSHYASSLPAELGAFNHFIDMSLQRRLSGPGLAVLTNDIKKRIAALNAVSYLQAAKRDVYWV